MVPLGPDRPVVPLTGRACGAPARPLVPLGPDRPVVVPLSPDRPVVPLGPDRPVVPLASMGCP